MSTNPFRRSSLKDPGAGSGGSQFNSVSSVSTDVPYAGADTPTPLSVNTKVPSTNQKHVNFASPPAIPISPVSYPPSPESVRSSPAYTFSKPVLPLPTDYSRAIQSDPFRAEAGPDENDGVIEQALQNAKTNSALVEPEIEASKDDAVKNTLSRFASAPRRTPPISQEAPATQNAIPPRPAMDVDAFKRLLLTGDSGQSTRQEDTSSTGAAVLPPINDNSSVTDSASISQRSLFDQGLAAEDSPRSSDDLDPVEVEAIHRSLVPSETMGGRKKPAPPTPRHGKPLKDDNGPKADADPLHFNTSHRPNTSKKPPAPPIARRRSQNSDIVRPGSSRRSSSSEVEQGFNPDDASSRAPPPPPPPKSRRPGSMAERRRPSDLPSTAEESKETGSSAMSSSRPSETRPSPPPARNSSKRVSVGTMNQPAPPPPRRGRGSSKSSVDSQRPPVSVTIGASTGESVNARPPEKEDYSANLPSGSSANDILADLEALQREVDDARRKVNR